MYTVLASAVNHPDAINPYVGLFNHRSLQAIDATDTEVNVVSPRPYAPPVGPYSEYRMIPETEQWGSYQVAHPRFLYAVPKRLFYGVAGNSFAKRVPRYVNNSFDVPDIVHACHMYLDGYGMLPYCRQHDIPLTVVAHGAFLNGYDDLSQAVRAKIDETLTACEKVLCVSDALARKAQRHAGESKIETVPIGASPERFPVERNEELRAELGIEQQKNVVLFVGEFCERKGLREIIDILPRFDSTQTEFVFVGHGGEMEAKLKQAVSKSDFSNQHVYTGITSIALRRWLAIADTLLLPSHAEGRPTVIYEAMASETAVLATGIGGIPEQVVDGETGVLVQSGDPDELEAGLRTMLDNPQRTGEMGTAGRQRLERKNWTWEGHAERVRSIHQATVQ